MKPSVKLTFNSDVAKSVVYLVAISIVMLMVLFTRSDSLARDTNLIVSQLSEYTKIPNVVTSVILGTRLFDTIGEVTVFTVAGLGVKILLGNEQTEAEQFGIKDQSIRILLNFAALLSFILAIDLALKGHLTPGGGFASGVAGATAVTILMLTGELQRIERLYFQANAAAMEKFAVVCFVIVAFTTFASFLIPDSIAASISPRVYIPLLNVIAAFKVTIGSWSILRLYILKRGVI